MPDLACSVSNCAYYDNRLCSLNSVDVSGGDCKEGTCCSSFVEAKYATNCTKCGTKETSVACKATDCTHNENCSCHAQSIDVGAKGNACSCHDTQCNSFCKC